MRRLTKIRTRLPPSFSSRPSRSRNFSCDGDVVEDFGDAVREHALGLDLDLLGVVGVLVGELHDADRQRRREEHRLALVVRRAAAQDPAQVPDEAHVEHAVGLVDDEDLDVPERDDALLLVVEQAARRADEQVRNPSGRLALEPVVDAAEDGEGRQARVAAEDLGVGADLGDELARRARRPGPAGRAAARARLVRSSRVKIVIRKAAVLPVPVWAWPATSVPARAIGRVFAWIGVAKTKPASAMPQRTSSGMGVVESSVSVRWCFGGRGGHGAGEDTTPLGSRMGRPRSPTSGLPGGGGEGLADARASRRARRRRRRDGGGPRERAARRRTAQVHQGRSGQ